MSPAAAPRSLADQQAIGQVHAFMLRGRLLVRHLDVHCPHFFRDGGAWVCRAHVGPCGTGATAEEAEKDWKRKRLEWAREPIPTPSKAGSRPLMALSHLPTENLHVPAATAVSLAK